jgi:hypothetical protein
MAAQLPTTETNGNLKFTTVFSFVNVQALKAETYCVLLFRSLLPK